MLWNIIKKAIHDIEMNNDLRFGNESWERLKQMEKEILAWQYKLEEELGYQYFLVENRDESQKRNCHYLVES